MFKRSSSIWRRLSRRERSKSPPQELPQPNKLQKRTTEPLRIETKHIITHLQRIDVPSKPVEKKPTAAGRVLASDMQTTPFPRSSRIHTVTWDIFLAPEQVYKLVMGFSPREMEDKWFIYSEGPDGSGKLKVHFHRSWTGMKIAELFVVVDLKGEGAGKVVGIKWNGSDQTNWMNEEEAKYMISTTCAWVLGVNFENSMVL